MVNELTLAYQSAAQGLVELRTNASDVTGDASTVEDDTRRCGCAGARSPYGLKDEESVAHSDDGPMVP
jgi:hypothetical protein